MDLAKIPFVVVPVLRQSVIVAILVLEVNQLAPVFHPQDSGGEGRFLSSSAGGEIGKDGIKGRLGVDLANVKSQGVQARVGLNVDSGISTSDDSLEVKAAGFGFSVGKQTGISTPFGEVKVDTDDCVIHKNKYKKLKSNTNMVMVKEIIIPKENKAQIVEIRYLEKQETTQTSKFLKSVLPTSYCMPDDDGVGVEIKVGTNSTGVNVASVKAGAVEARLRPNVDTGASAGTDGVEVKATGFGVSVGRKTGISTPLGEVAVNTDDCVIQ
ncbi:9184_t:CDS:2 [Ambispora leptoticha]|uniref:9184_t:CDS:1 n=1 Tax=Ambispora leptoticha TaxID=144679 RepID=A0A9N9F6U5_9GLOM|nr:9184_t:CDS:2 [Ambispora leptoticha]